MKQDDKQRGITLIGLIFWGAILAFVVVIGAQAVPTATEYFAIQKAVDQAAKAGPTVADIRSAYSKMADVDYISSVTAQDLNITKVNDKVVVSFAYNKEIHIAGPVFLLIKYAGQSH
ncbi:MAG: DUF4845 domain-containing protein [Thiomonas sp.]|nr:DUF4845 domain-containing protein [Thiomonas sp.]